VSIGSSFFFLMYLDRPLPLLPAASYCICRP